MRASQHGLSAFGMLVILAIAVAAGYYAYQGVSGGDDAPTCKSTFTACMQKCRRTTTEAPAAQACQEGCRGDLAACERPGR
jgi:hypothetical protein